MRLHGAVHRDLAPTPEGDTAKASIASGCERVICLVERAVAGRVDRLMKQVRAQLGVSTKSLPRAALLRALVVRGLDRAEPHGILIAFESPRTIRRCEVLLTELEINRVARFRSARWSKSTQPPLEQLHGALVRSAVPLAELEAGFAHEVLLSRLPPASEKP